MRKIIDSNWGRAVSALVVGISLTGCLIGHKKMIKADAVVDPRLEGAWKIASKDPGEIRGELDEDDLGANGYLIFQKVAEGTHKCFMIDHIELHGRTEIGEFLVSTRKHGGRTFLLVSAMDPEPGDDADEIQDWGVDQWVVDYEFDDDGELFLRGYMADLFEEMSEARPMKFEKEEKPFAATVLKGGEKEMLEFYSDPKVRAFLTSFGKYQKLTLPDEK